MRESIFEKYRKSELDCNAEFKKIRDLIKENEYIFNERYKKSKLSYLAVDIFGALQVIVGEPVEARGYFDSDPLDNIDISIDIFLDILEFLKNAIPCKNYSDCAYQMFCVIDMCLLKLGYTCKLDDEGRLVLYLKNPEAEAIATMVEKSTATKIYDYLVIRRDNVEAKRTALKSLSDDIEVLCTKYKDDNVVSKVSQIMQCVRHTKKKMQPKYPFFFEKEEEWMDKLFEMFMYVLSIPKTKKYIEEFKSLENSNS